MDGLTEGRIIHVVLSNGKHRPAIIVGVINKEAGMINATIFTDWRNDFADGSGASGLFWATTISYSDAHEPNTWHWIEKA